MLEPPQPARFFHVSSLTPDVEVLQLLVVVFIIQQIFYSVDEPWGSRFLIILSLELRFLGY
jgi:hypothetical protein